MEKEKHSFIAGGIANWCSGNQSGGSSEIWKQISLKTQQYHSWEYAQKIPHHASWAHIHTMFIATLFVITRSWKQPTIPQQKNGYRKCGSFIQWSTTQLLRMRTTRHLFQYSVSYPNSLLLFPYPNTNTCPSLCLPTLSTLFSLHSEIHASHLSSPCCFTFLSLYIIA